MAGVITGPGAVFEDVKGRAVRSANWVVPLALACLATMVYLGVAFSRPAVVAGVRDQQRKVMEKQVAAGKMTKAVADQVTAMGEKFMTPTVLAAFGAMSAILSSVAGLFAMGVVIWMTLRWGAGVEVDYMKVVEVCGLALVIDVPQKLIRSFLVLWRENLMATVSPALFLSNPSAGRRGDVLLSIFDAVDIWWLAVLALGVSKVTGVSYRTAGCITFGWWFGYRILAVLLIPT